MIFAWLGDRSQHVLAWLASHAPLGRQGARLTGDAILAIGVLLIAVTAARLLMALQVSRDRRQASAPLVTGNRSARALALAAARAADAGAYDAAVRSIFSAAVVLLDLRGVLSDEHGATINDLRRVLRAKNAAIERPFADLARAYSTAAYAEA
ncbi:MAG: hypothetical protein ABI282_03020, partial [Candidatus Baltobacteraceae bacterium]